MMRFLIAFIVVWMSAASAAHAQEADVPTIPYEGIHLFCHVLHTNEMTPVTSWAEAMKHPEQTAIIIFGDPALVSKPTHDREWRYRPGLRDKGGNTNIADALGGFLKNGGSLLIATDHEFRAPLLGVFVTGNRVAVPQSLRNQYAYRDELDCPRLANSGHPLVDFSRQGIATNLPSEVRLLGRAPGLVPISSCLFVPPGLDLPANYMIASGKNAPPHGRALYIAGHGMFINAMMAQTDNDNTKFADNAISWLREGPKDGPQHSKVLFYVNGDIVKDFDMKLTPPMPPIPIPPAEALSRLVRGWENERFFQKMLADALGRHMGRFIAIVLAIVTFIVLIYGVKKFMEGRHHFETKVPILLGPSPVAKTPSEERQQAILRMGDFWEPSRRLALDWLRHEFDITPDRWLAGIDARFQANGGFWSRWRLKRQADFILQLARTANGARLSRHQFFVLVETLRELGAAVKDGRLALLVEGKNVKQAFSYQPSAFSHSKPARLMWLKADD
jgi:hypothetical protein